MGYVKTGIVPQVEQTFTQLSEPGGIFDQMIAQARSAYQSQLGALAQQQSLAAAQLSRAVATGTMGAGAAEQALTAMAKETAAQALQAGAQMQSAIGTITAQQLGAEQAYASTMAQLGQNQAALYGAAVQSPVQVAQEYANLLNSLYGVLAPGSEVRISGVPATYTMVPIEEQPTESAVGTAIKIIS